MHIMSILCSSADAISSGSCPILFKVLTLNVAICSVCLHFSSFDCLSSVADFSNTEARTPTSAGRAPLFYPREERCGLCKWFECGSWLSFDGCFILFYRSHSYRGAAVVPRSKLSILSEKSSDSRPGPIWVLSLVVHCFIQIPLRTSCCFPCVHLKKKKKINK